MKTENIEEYARLAEQRVTDSLVDEVDPFRLNEARVYGLDGYDSELVLVASANDLYELLERPKVGKRARLFGSVIIVTTGWASRLTDDGEIDHDVERVRVRLSVVVNDGVIASVMRFADDSQTPVVDIGSATGALADAVNRIFG